MGGLSTLVVNDEFAPASLENKPDEIDNQTKTVTPIKTDGFARKVTTGTGVMKAESSIEKRTFVAPEDGVDDEVHEVSLEDVSQQAKLDSIDLKKNSRSMGKIRGRRNRRRYIPQSEVYWV